MSSAPADTTATPEPVTTSTSAASTATATMVENNASASPAVPTPSTNVERRVATHSHIKGLGLLPDGTPDPTSTSFIGQLAAREAAGILVEMVRARRMAGRAILLAGDSGTGKTALALAVSQELGPKVPFRPIVGSELFSAEVKKTEVLMENMRRAIGLRVREIKEVWEGEVLEVVPQETMTAGGARQISSVSVSLRTAKGSRTIKLEPSVYESLLRARVTVGDVIYIEANAGLVKRLGRLDSLRHTIDLEADEFVPLPKGEVYKRREVVQEVTLHDLDMANASPSAAAANDPVTTLMNSMMMRLGGGGGGTSTAARRTEITEKLRQEINKLVNRYIEQGIGELIPGVLFIDEAHILDLECFSYLNRALESPLAPIMILATNRGMSPVRGSTDSIADAVLSPHGIPHELLDRLLIIRTTPYSLEEMTKIIAIRGRAEGIPPMAEETLRALAEVASRSSLRYALQLLTLVATTATLHGRPVAVEDIQEVTELFLDTKRSAELLLVRDAQRMQE